MRESIPRSTNLSSLSSTPNITKFSSYHPTNELHTFLLFLNQHQQSSVEFCVRSVGGGELRGEGREGEVKIQMKKYLLSFGGVIYTW
jgi:hypothetical protein